MVGRSVGSGLLTVLWRALLRDMFFFFFSSRRRHTRCSRDWSSDVCSSDLTSSMTVHQLKDMLIEAYVTPKERPGLAVSLVSFGFKHGVPFDADLVFDVRFLPNPHFVEKLRPLDGREHKVREFVMKHAESRELLRHVEDFLRFVLPAYQREGKAYLTIAVGCTGGRHRSVALVEELRPSVGGLGLSPTLVHRDIDRE